ncbi:MAG TPA: hypothetical protein DIU10_13085 [Sulfitobacter sp.]|uniref:Uncharacterized protein n=1 Tax=Sulfitobacter profundi TaxID=2679961 RepID=A0ABW1YYH0_9RHOB|nr:hypothetical protein [Sulfitobacter sp.]HCQ58814.1 hypothetical protein [Sulfitobacter sp.]
MALRDGLLRVRCDLCWSVTLI